MFVAKLFNELELAQLYFYQNVSYNAPINVKPAGGEAGQGVGI